MVDVRENYWRTTDVEAEVDSGDLETPPMTREQAEEIWAPAAHEILTRVAGTYQGLIQYGEQLAAEVQETTGVHTRKQVRRWIAPVLAKVAAANMSRDEPPLAALVVNKSDGTVGAAYDEVLRVTGADGIADPVAREKHAAAARLECYRWAGATMPDDGGRAALSPRYEQIQARLRKERRAAEASTPPASARSATCRSRRRASATTATRELGRLDPGERDAEDDRAHLQVVAGSAALDHPADTAVVLPVDGDPGPTTHPDPGRARPRAQPVELGHVVGMHLGRAAVVGPVEQVGRVEAREAAPAGHHPLRAAVPLDRVPGRADPQPRRLDARGVGRHAPLPRAADGERRAPPGRVVTVARPDQGVGDLVEDRVADLAVGVEGRQRGAQTERAGREPADTRPALGGVVLDGPLGQAVHLQQVLGEGVGVAQVHVADATSRHRHPRGATTWQAPAMTSSTPR